MGVIRRHHRELLLGALGISSVFDGDTFELYMGSTPQNAGSMLATGTIPATAFAPIGAGERAKAGTWQTGAATRVGNVGGMLLRSVGDSVRAWIPVVVAPSAGDVLAIDAVDVLVADTVTIDTLTWTNP